MGGHLSTFVAFLSVEIKSDQVSKITGQQPSNQPNKTNMIVITALGGGYEHSKFEANVDYVKSCLKKNKTTKKLVDDMAQWVNALATT